MKIGIIGLAPLISIAIVIIFLYYMNAKGIEYTEDNSTPLMGFSYAMDWLSDNLKSNDIALVPHVDLFYSLNPQFRSHLKDYKIIWYAANVPWRANTTDDEVTLVKQYLEAVILHESRLKFLVLDWFYPYSNRVLQSCSDLGTLLYEAKRFEFQSPNNIWKNKVIICEVN